MNFFKRFINYEFLKLEDEYSTEVLMRNQDEESFHIN
jgi:hypothetical protein